MQRNRLTFGLARCLVSAAWLVLPGQCARAFSDPAEKEVLGKAAIVGYTANINSFTYYLGP